MTFPTVPLRGDAPVVTPSIPPRRGSASGVRYCEEASGTTLTQGGGGGSTLGECPMMDGWIDGYMDWIG